MSHNCHCHSNTPKNYNWAFGLGILLNLTYVIIEIVFGLITKSTALLADAGHNFNDVLFLILAWFSVWISTKGVSKFKTYGFKKMTIIAPLVSTIVLYISLFFVMVESFQRVLNPINLNGTTIMIVSGIGFIINIITALFFVKSSNDINIKSVFVHMLSDAFISLGVIFSGLLILTTGFVYIDSIVCLLIIGIIFYTNFGILKTCTNLIFDGVPEHINIEEIKTYFKNMNHVRSFHELHVWSLGSTEHCLTIHLVVKNKDSIIEVPFIIEELKERFNIEHSTIQITESHCCRNKVTKYN